MSSEREEGESSQHVKTGSEDQYLPPLSPASDVVPSNYARARFDEGLAFAIREETKRRAPSQWSEWEHQVGFAGELATSGYLRVPMNREVYPNHSGDQGYDLTLPLHGDTWSIEVKTVYDGDLELIVEEDKVEDADYFVLCRTTNPTELVELIGWITRPGLKSLGQTSPKDSKIHVPHRFLNIFEPVWIRPDQIREAQTV